MTCFETIYYNKNLQKILKKINKGWAQKNDKKINN